MNVLEAARQRIAWVFQNVPRIYLSFSGGKDSGVLFHLLADEARRTGRKFGVFFVDWECQYKLTIDYVAEMIDLYRDVIDLYWICLPMKTVNAVSVFEPEWIAWEEGKTWVREKPAEAISNPAALPFYRKNMTFEEFAPKFGKWYAGKRLTVNFIGIRTAESLNRWRTIFRSRKQTLRGYSWTTWAGEYVYHAYPIHDWKTEDIWTYNGKFGKSYNRLYDRFYQAGLSIHQMRICEPFGNEQRRGLSLFQVIEPETWGRMVARVNGANFGAEYAKEAGIILGNHHVTKPEGYTWRQFAEMLLASIPEATAEHYRNKFSAYLNWWQAKDPTGQWPEGIPDEQPGDTGPKDIPSWRRLCKCLLRNDYWCKMLCFSPTKNEAYEQYCKLMKKRRQLWNIF